MLTRPAIVLDRCSMRCHGASPKDVRVLLVRRRMLRAKYLAWCFGCNLRARFYGPKAIEDATAAAHVHVCPPAPAVIGWPDGARRAGRSR